MKTTALAVAALSGLFALPSLALADHHRGGGERFGGWGRFDDRGHRGGSRFSFSLGLGAIFTPSYRSYDSCDYYTPTYQTYYAPTYYAPAPVVYAPAPIVYAAPAPTVVYYSPAPRYYYDSCYSTPSTYVRVESRYSYRR